MFAFFNPLNCLITKFYPNSPAIDSQFKSLFIRCSFFPATVNSKNHLYPDYNRALLALSIVTLIVTTFLLYMGAFTTSIGAGMVFEDWPTSNGSFNPDGWMTDIAMFAEHSHRLLGAIVGLLTITLTIWILVADKRKWMKMLVVTALLFVILQGLLGGFRVLKNDLHFAMVHGCLAQGVFCILISIAVGQTKTWHSLQLKEAGLNPHAKSVKRLGLFVCALIFTQLIVGAIMRHSGAGLAIHTFPLTPTGGLIPEEWNFRVAIHFAHRCMALTIFFVYLYWALRVVSSKSLDTVIRVLGGLGILLLFTQVSLGASIIWLSRAPVPTTFHVLVGAFLLAISWVITFLQFNISNSPVESAQA